MLKNRLCYLFVLICTTAFFICFNGYYSMYVFLLSLALPVLSAVISLPGMLRLRFTVCAKNQPSPVRITKSQAITLWVCAVSRWILPFGRARAVLDITNSFTGGNITERLEFSPGRRPQILEHSFSCPVCGVVDCRLRKARVYDLLGLFWLPVRRPPEDCRIIVHPTVFTPNLELASQRIPGGSEDRYSPYKPGYDPTELFGLRDYRPGDKLNRIDWKLSQKSPSLLVREGSLPIRDRALLLVSLCKDSVAADAAMDILATISDYLMRNQVEHSIGFTQSGALRFISLSEPKDCRPAMEEILLHTDRGPMPSAAPDSFPRGVSRIVYICPQPDQRGISLLEELYPGAQVSILGLSTKEDEPPLRNGLHELHVLRVRPGHIAADLDGFMF